MKKIFAFVLMAVLVLSLSAAAFAAPATYNVGVCQLVQHPALDAATQGFQDALKEKLGEDAVKFSVQNASGDSATCAVICNQFVSDEVDLILANATPALLAAQSATNKIPILGTSVTDYASALDIDDWNGATGTKSPAPPTVSRPRPRPSCCSRSLPRQERRPSLLLRRAQLQVPGR